MSKVERPGREAKCGAWSEPQGPNLKLLYGLILRPLSWQHGVRS